MLKYHVAVCDDEKSDLDGIVQSVQQYDVQGCFDIETYMDGNELLSELQMQKKSFDLLLLDIEMPSNGFQLAQSLIQMEKHPLVVFVTKRHEYAVQGYGIAFRYLVKPLDQTLFVCGNGCRPSGTELQTFHDRIRWCYHVLGNIGHLLSGKPRT
ncbi:MAG: LytR/AlgR family response regulator transcription factor [Faecalibacterium prausnitzii]